MKLLIEIISNQYTSSRFSVLRLGKHIVVTMNLQS